MLVLYLKMAIRSDIILPNSEKIKVNSNQCQLRGLKFCNIISCDTLTLKISFHVTLCTTPSTIENQQEGNFLLEPADPMFHLLTFGNLSLKTVVLLIGEISLPLKTVLLLIGEFYLSLETVYCWYLLTWSLVTFSWHYRVRDPETRIFQKFVRLTVTRTRVTQSPDR